MPAGDGPPRILDCRDCAVFGSTGDGVLIADAQGNIVEVNDSFCRITGYTRAEVLGRNPRMMKSDRHDAEFYARMWQAIGEQGQWQGEVWDRRKNGEVFPRWLTISAIEGADGRITHYVGILSDLTSARRSEAELEQLAHYDPLTGLPNRILFRDRLAQAMGQARRGGRKLALLCVDLDGFKPVNDAMGHAAGDALLAAVAERLRSSLRTSDTVARLAGDEFTVLLTEIAGPNDVALVCRKILDILVAPFTLAWRDVHVSASIGVATFPEDGVEVDLLLANADAAMYRAKEAGRNRYQFFSRSMHARAVAQMELEAELRLALERDELVLHYQPQVNPKDGRLVGVEALVRWNHPRQGLLAPARFIHVAEETGLIVPLGEWVMRAACRQSRAWIDDGFPPLRVAVNLAAQQFEEPRLVDRIAAWLIEQRLQPTQLEVEITESSAMSNPELTIERLHEIKAIGIHVSVDDFGTGYSSLSYLKRFPVDTLKIDRSFLRDIPDDQDNATLCSAMIGLAHNLGLRVVAEGVENLAQCEFLRDLDCDELQGYLFSRPVPPSELAALRKARPSLLPPATGMRANLPATEIRRPRAVTPAQAGRQRFPSEHGRQRLPSEPGRSRHVSDAPRGRAPTPSRRIRTVPPKQR
jgi:diguanylate cyclase (GGDEF)-like protein/PAS domain S-box-containing protein